MVSIANRMSGAIKIGGMDCYDYGRIALVAKEFASTIPWVRENITIVVPSELMAPLSDIMAPDGTGEDLYKYATIDDDEVETQATWEID